MTDDGRREINSASRIEAVEVNSNQRLLDATMLYRNTTPSTWSYQRKKRKPDRKPTVLNRETSATDLRDDTCPGEPDIDFVPMPCSNFEQINKLIVVCLVFLLRYVVLRSCFCSLMLPPQFANPAPWARIRSCSLHIYSSNASATNSFFRVPASLRIHHHPPYLGYKAIGRHVATQAFGYRSPCPSKLCHDKH